MEAEINLSPASLRRLCRGNAKNLPRLCVHNNDVWPAGVVQPDAKGRIHMRRLTFENVVAPQVPTRPGLWLRPDMQEFHIDLRDDQLDGDGTQDRQGQAEYRAIATDKRKCPECGASMTEVKGISETDFRMCSSCNYSEGFPLAEVHVPDEAG